VIHGDTISYSDGELLQASRDIISEILSGCFYHADSLNLKSVALPLIGCGVAGFPIGDCLDMMFRFIARKLLVGVTCVEEVRITHLDPKDTTERWYALVADRMTSDETASEAGDSQT